MSYLSWWHNLDLLSPKLETFVTLLIPLQSHLADLTSNVFLILSLPFHPYVHWPSASSFLSYLKGHLSGFPVSWS